MAVPNEDSLHAPNPNENSTDIRNEHMFTIVIGIKSTL